MKKSKMVSLLLTGFLSISLGAGSVYGAEGEIADMQAWKQEAEAGLEEVQANVNSMESKKQELEYYLADLNAQYEELTNSISELSIEAGQKEEELKIVRRDLKKAKKASKKQYEDMKLRIAYMYERGGVSALELLLSSGNLAEFINRAENVSQISQYDRNMLEKYDALQVSIQEKEKAIEEESASVNAMMAERSAKKQEVQLLAENTSDNIASYIAQISASEEEAMALRSEISSADNSISALIQQAEEAKAREEAEEEYDNTDYSDDSYDNSENGSEDYDSSGDSQDYDESSESESGNDDYTESAGEESAGQESSGGSGQGTYLGNFTLTAYCNCAQCCGSAGNLTASGTVPTAGRTVAMAGVPFGTQLLINGNVYTVEDLGTPYGHVDIFFNNHSDALGFGLQSAEVYQL